MNSATNNHADTFEAFVTRLTTARKIYIWGSATVSTSPASPPRP
jgi:hypothetical protein